MARKRVCALVFAGLLQFGTSEAAAQESMDALKMGLFAFIERDYVHAAPLLEEAARDGHAEAQYTLGLMHHRGHGVIQNHAEATRWYRMAAEQDHISAQIKLASAHGTGRGAEYDLVKSAYWSRQAAEQGHASAQYSLGIHYEHGQGVPQDHAEAVRWYRQAYEQEYISVEADLARILATSPSVRDARQALVYAQEYLALGEDSDAYNLLAAAYAAGGQFDQAVRAQKTAIAIAGEDLRTQDTPTPRYLNMVQVLMPVQLRLYEQGQMLSCPGAGCEKTNN